MMQNRSRPELSYTYCSLCLSEVPPDETPGSYGRLSVGSRTGDILEVWCDRHDVCIYAIRDRPPRKLFCHGLGHTERNKLGYRNQ